MRKTRELIIAEDKLVVKDNASVVENPHTTTDNEINDFEFIGTRPEAKAVVLENIESFAVKSENSANDQRIGYAYIGTDTTSLGDYCFKDCDALTDVDLFGPLSVGIKSFYDCNALTAVNNAGNLRHAGFRSFAKSKINAIRFDKLSSISPYAFNNMSELTTVDLPAVKDLKTDPDLATKYRNNSVWDKAHYTYDYDNGLWENFRDDTIQVSLSNKDIQNTIAFRCLTNGKDDNGQVENVIGTTHFAVGPFFNCRKLKNVNLENLSSLGGGTFRDCYSLTSVNMPNVKEIGDMAFGRIKRVNSSTAGQRREYALMYDAMDQDEIDAKEFVPIESFKLDYLERVGVRSFEFMRYLKKFEANSLSSINDEAFFRCVNLSSVNFPAIKKIGERAFFGCDSLTDFDAPDTEIKSIAGSAFGNMKSLSSINMPNLIKIEDFDASKLIHNYNNPSNHSYYTTVHSNSTAGLTVEDVKYGAFGGCKHLSSVNIEGVNYVGSYAFQDSGVKTINLPNVATLNAGAFRDCSELTSVTIGDLLTEIGSSAFENDTALTDFTALAITSIGAHAFDGCTSLSYLEHTPMNPTIADNEADNNQLKTVEEYAFANCTSLTSIYLPVDINNNSNHTLPAGLFAGCTSLKEVQLGRNEKTSLGGKYGELPFLIRPSQDTFKDVPAGFKVYVPSSMYKSLSNDPTWINLGYVKYLAYRVEPDTYEFKVTRSPRNSYIITNGISTVRIDNAKKKTGAASAEIRINKITDRNHLNDSVDSSK